MQATLTAGDSLDFTRTVPDYPATDGWTLKYRLVPRDVGGSAIEITAAASGADYRVQESPTTTGAWDPGAYGWSSWLEKTGARHVLDSGQITIFENPETIAAGTDTRSQAQKAVDDLKAAYASYTASQGTIAEYEIAGRRMRFSSGGEIISKMDFWKGELTRENAAKAVAMGLADPRRIYCRYGRA